MTINELNTKKTSLIVETRNIVETAKKEKREMTVEEQQLFDNNLKEIENLKLQIADYQQQLLDLAMNKSEEKEDPKEEETPKTEETPENEETPKTDEESPVEDPKNEEEKPDEEVEDNPKSDDETPKTDNDEDPVNEETPKDEEEMTDENSDENKTKRNFNIHMNTFITKEIRSAIENGSRKFELPSEKRAVQVTGSNGVHDDVIEEMIPGLLEPLYADNIISKMGCRMYKGLPLSDIRLPEMGKGTAGWIGEVSAASASNNTFSSVLLQPKRISAYLDISKELIVQDTIGVEDALRRDIYNALVSKVQETFLSADAGTTTKPAGIFNGVTATNITSYEDLCDAEAKVEDSNANGVMRYIMSNKAKAIVRSMKKSALTNELVWAPNDIDGTEVISNSQIPTTMYAFGDFSNIVFANFGDIEVIVDPYTQAVNGCIRLVINAYFDWKKTRAGQDVIVYGSISRPEEG